MKKMIIAAPLLIIMFIVDIFVIRGSYTWIIYGLPSQNLTISMDKQDVLEIEDIYFDKEGMCTKVKLRAVAPGEVRVNANPAGAESTETGVEIKVNKLLFIYEKDHIGSLDKLTPQMIAEKKANLITLETAIHNYENKLKTVAGKLPDASGKLSSKDVAKHVIFNNYLEKNRTPGVTAAEKQAKKNPGF